MVSTFDVMSACIRYDVDKLIFAIALLDQHSAGHD